MKRLELSDTERADIERDIKKYWNPCPRAYPRKVANLCKTITGEVRAGAVWHNTEVAILRPFSPRNAATLSTISAAHPISGSQGLRGNEESPLSGCPAFVFLPHADKEGRFGAFPETESPAGLRRELISQAIKQPYIFFKGVPTEKM